jgi:putative phage-type endonuclease
MAEPAENLQPVYRVVCDTSDEAAWLAHRGLGIGASEIAILLGESNWGSNLELYYRKTGEFTEPLQEESEEMELGRAFEEIARRVVAKRAGVALQPIYPQLCQSLVHPWALATCDAITTAVEPVEVKNLNWGFDAEEWSEQIPEKYVLQCQQQMLVLGADRCLFGALLSGSRLIWEWVPRDEVRIRKIIRAGSEFWRHVEDRVPPPSDGHPHARKVLGRLAANGNEDTVELYESEMGSQLHAYELAKARHARAATEEKAAQRALDATKDELAKLLGEHRSAVTSTGWTLRWKTTERRGFTVKPNTLHQFEIKPPKEK